MTHIEAETIGTARLVLEPLRIEHAEPMALVLADPQLHTFIGGVPDTAPQLRSRYARMLAGPSDPAESWCNWMIRLRENRELTGTVQATIGPVSDATATATATDTSADADADRDTATDADTDTSADADRDTDAACDADGLQAEIAWVVGTAWQGRGIATEAARALVDWLARQPVHAVIAHIHPDHRASAAVAAAIGLAPTAELHDGEIRWRKSVDRRLVEPDTRPPGM